MLRAALRRTLTGMQRGLYGHGAGSSSVRWSERATSSIRVRTRAHGTSSETQHRLTWPHRTHLAGALRETHVGESVSLCGWVDRVRHLGAISFVDLRDHSGLCQVVVDAEAAAELRLAAGRLRPETVVCVRGVVRRRRDPNPALASGFVEAAPAEIEVVNAVQGALPIAVSDAAAESGDGLKDEVRLRHRILDLRWEGVSGWGGGSR